MHCTTYAFTVVSVSSDSFVKRCPRKGKISYKTSKISLVSQIPFNDKTVQWASRQKAVKDFCNSTLVVLKKEWLQSKSEYRKKILSNIVHIPRLNLNWCLVPKVASSSISMSILPYLPDKKFSQSWKTVHDQVWARAGRLGLDKLPSHDNTASFLVTRHPFARIVSAFRNKLENRSRSHDGDYFYENYSKKIIRLDRAISMKVNSMVLETQGVSGIKI